MRDNIEAARQRLSEGGYTCVVFANGKEYTSSERGVSPLIGFLQSGASFCGAVAADKTVGAGAAHLYVLLGIHALWANVISDDAIRILTDNGITVVWGERVPYIINRKGDGRCPIEIAVSDAKSSEEAYTLIIAVLNKLRLK